MKVGPSNKSPALQLLFIQIFSLTSRIGYRQTFVRMFRSSLFGDHIKHEKQYGSIITSINIKIFSCSHPSSQQATVLITIWPKSFVLG